MGAFSADELAAADRFLQQVATLAADHRIERDRGSAPD
jgi:hypothetical protein